MVGWNSQPCGHRKFRVYGKMSDMVRPGPAKTWVLLDEDYRSINDAAFAVTMVSSTFLDAPASYHGGACGFAFGDGHSEIKRWKDSRTIARGNSYSAHNLQSGESGRGLGSGAELGSG